MGEVVEEMLWGRDPYWRGFIDGAAFVAVVVVLHDIVSWYVS